MMQPRFGSGMNRICATLAYKEHQDLDLRLFSSGQLSESYVQALPPKSALFSYASRPLLLSERSLALSRAK